MTPQEAKLELGKSLSRYIEEKEVMGVILMSAVWNSFDGDRYGSFNTHVGLFQRVLLPEINRLCEVVGWPPMSVWPDSSVRLLVGNGYSRGIVYRSITKGDTRNRIYISGLPTVAPTQVINVTFTIDNSKDTAW